MHEHTIFWYFELYWSIQNISVIKYGRPYYIFWININTTTISKKVSWLIKVTIISFLLDVRWEVRIRSLSLDNFHYWSHSGLLKKMVELTYINPKWWNRKPWLQFNKKGKWKTLKSDEHFVEVISPPFPFLSSTLSFASYNKVTTNRSTWPLSIPCLWL